MNKKGFRTLSVVMAFAVCAKILASPIYVVELQGTTSASNKPKKVVLIGDLHLNRTLTQEKILEHIEQAEKMLLPLKNNENAEIIIGGCTVEKPEWSSLYSTEKEIFRLLHEVYPAEKFVPQAFLTRLAPRLLNSFASNTIAIENRTFQVKLALTLSQGNVSILEKTKHVEIPNEFLELRTRYPAEAKKLAFSIADILEEMNQTLLSMAEKIETGAAALENTQRAMHKEINSLLTETNKIRHAIKASSKAYRQYLGADYNPLKLPFERTLSDSLMSLADLYQKNLTISIRNTDVIDTASLYFEENIRAPFYLALTSLLLNPHQLTPLLDMEIAWRIMTSKKDTHVVFAGDLHVHGIASWLKKAGYNALREQPIRLTNQSTITTPELLELIKEKTTELETERVAKIRAGEKHIWPRDNFAVEYTVSLPVEYADLSAISL